MIEVTSQRFAASRWAARAPRLAAVGASAVLAVAGLRGAFADAPAPAVAPARTDVRDTVTEAVAQEFARDYLTLDVADRDTERLLKYGAHIEAPRGPRGLRRGVEWTAVSGVSRRGRSSTVTVIAGTSRGRLALAVEIERAPNGVRRVATQPALVAVPMLGSARSVTRRPVDDAALTVVIRRALKNYLARDTADLSADLAPGVAPLTPPAALRLRSVDAVTWVASPRRVAADVRVVDADRIAQRLSYQLTVQRRGGRWLVLAVHDNPDSEVQP